MKKCLNLLLILILAALNQAPILCMKQYTDFPFNCEQDIESEEKAQNSSLSAQTSKPITSTDAPQFSGFPSLAPEKNQPPQQNTENNVQPPFKCAYCFNIKTQRDLSVHLMVMHPTLKIFKCPHQNCNFTANSQNGLQNHTNTNHPNEKLFKCPHCLFTTASIIGLFRHLGESHERRFSHPDQNCDFDIKKLQRLYLITASIEKIGSTCPYCNFSTRTPSGLSMHIGREHPHERTFPCPAKNCDFVTGSTGTLKKHIADSHHGKKLFKCPHCDIAKSELKHMKEHIKEKHFDGTLVESKTVNTNSSDQITTTTFAVAPPQIIEKNAQATISHGTSSTVQTTTRDNNSVSYTCPKCSIIIAGLENYEQHKRTHNKIDPY